MAKRERVLAFFSVVLYTRRIKGTSTITKICCTLKRMSQAGLTIKYRRDVGAWVRPESGGVCVMVMMEHAVVLRPAVPGWQPEVDGILVGKGQRSRHVS